MNWIAATGFITVILTFVLSATLEFELSLKERKSLLTAGVFSLLAMISFVVVSVILDQHSALLISTIFGGISLLILLRVASRLSAKIEK